MKDRQESPDDNPFRVNSPRNVLARARQRIELIRHWLIRHDPPEHRVNPTPPADQDKPR